MALAPELLALCYTILPTPENLNKLHNTFLCIVQFVDWHKDARWQI